jgi:hypothetical protein
VRAAADGVAPHPNLLFCCSAVLLFYTSLHLPMRYRMIGIDLDGTLLDRRGRVSDENRRAVERARDAGVIVVPCTGRGWRESREALAAIDAAGPGVFVTGAAVSDAQSGRTLDLAQIEPHLVLRIIRHLADQPEAVLVFRDEALAGHDYLVTGAGSLTPNTQWWFQRTGATVHYQQHVSLDDVHHCLRVGVVATEPRMRQLTAHLRRHLTGRVLLHSFAAVQMPDPAQTLHILEVFAPGVDKWRGLTWIARAHGIEGDQIAVIGDEINDVQMLASAGCGIAMGNAIDEAKALASHVTADCDHAGVAVAIGRLLSGEWR